MPEFYCVTLNGHPIGVRMTKPAAEAMAERWQGERYRKGLLKHADLGDWVEVRRDTVSEREFDRMYDDLKMGKPQTIQTIGGS